MKPAVLAYCQEACPIVDSEYVMSPGTKLVHRVLKGDWTQWELQCWNGGTCQWERAFCASPYMGDDDPHFGYLYRIFGLEKMVDTDKPVADEIGVGLEQNLYISGRLKYFPKYGTLPAVSITTQ